MLLRAANTFGLIIHSTADGTRPSSGIGTQITPATNAYGSYATLLSGAALTDDCYEIEIVISNVATSTVARDCVVSIGLDPAGGTSFTSLVDLVAGPANVYTSGGGPVVFRFPLFIKAGTSIGAAAAVNSATLTNLGVLCRARCRPSRPDVILVGQYIDQFGVTLASSSGTAVTEGGAAEGAWTQLGSALTRPCWYWDFGYGCNNATIAQSTSDLDLGIGDASNKNIIVSNARVTLATNEAVSKPSPCAFGVGVVGDIVYARSQGATLSTGVSVAAYGVGG